MPTAHRVAKNALMVAAYAIVTLIALLTGSTVLWVMNFNGTVSVPDAVFAVFNFGMTGSLLAGIGAVCVAFLGLMRELATF